jgi:peptidyl-prolyl cis-trans isomerase-like 4
MISTSAGVLVVDLFTTEAPVACRNFLKLCKVKYYHGCLFWNVQPNFIVQSGDPCGNGSGGRSIYGLCPDPNAAGLVSNAFKDEIGARKINETGLVCMAHADGKQNANKSQFFITLRADGLEYLDGKHTIVGKVSEGIDVLQTINSLYCDGDGRPFQDVRILHTDVLEDPYEDPVGMGMLVPPSSPKGVYDDIPTYTPSEEKVRSRLAYEEDPTASSALKDKEGNARSEGDLDESIRRKEAQSRAVREYYQLGCV